FSFPSAPEVGRIIDTSQRASTVIFQNLVIPRFAITYIEEHSWIAQYIAHNSIILHHVLDTHIPAYVRTHHRNV
ncbi:hypothetical protein, partial [Pseudomonas syringae]|uniref:hypothetical protein n=3 Tax=Pseudomonas syringae group TaxID=136849 RepID=UPI001C803E80